MSSTLFMAVAATSRGSVASAPPAVHLEPDGPDGRSFRSVSHSGLARISGDGSSPASGDMTVRPDVRAMVHAY